jgi:NAD(P)-dependent dehydrogenase (short-subunit alcohol dehydrogenase family)
VGTADTRTIVVVGAAGGIGIEVVRQLQHEARVIAIVQNQEQMQQVSSLVWGSFECNLADAVAVGNTVATVSQIAGDRLDGLVFCAAMQPVGPVELIRRADLERLFAVNVFGTLQLVQGVLPALRRAHGRIVLFSSLAGRVAAPMLGAYASSKFCLEGLADALRRELRPSGVSVTLIEPGGVDTPMAAAQFGLVEQALSSLEGDAGQIYGPLYRGYSVFARKALRFASHPRDVARIAVKAVLHGRRPKARYVVGGDAKFTVTLARCVPGSWLDAILMKLSLGS